MVRRILVIVPLFITPKESEKIKNELNMYAWNGTNIKVIGLQGNIAVNSRAEAAVATPEFLDLVIKAEKEGYDAVVSYCYVDVGVDAAKEIVKIPVLGPLSTSATFANMLGQKFSVITVGTTRRIVFPRLRELQLDSNYVSTRGVDFDKFFLFSGNIKHVEIMKQALTKECRKALDDEAHVLIWGCTGFPLAEDLKKKLKVPIIEGTITLKVAEVLIDLKQSYKHQCMHSALHDVKKPNPSEKPKMRIKVLIPTSTSLGSKSIRKLNGIANEGTKISVISFKNGPKSIKSASEAAGVLPFIIKQAKNAGREGFNAVIICSFEDIGIEPAREVSDIPVVGPSESSMLVACMLGKKFSILNNDKRVHVALEKTARKIGVEKQLLSIRSLNGELEDEKLVSEIHKVIAEGAETLIVGEVNNPELFELVHSNVRIPILDPLCAALKIAEALHSLKLSHSKLSYPNPALPAYHKARIKKLTKTLRQSMFLYENKKAGCR